MFQGTCTRLMSCQLAVSSFQAIVLKFLITNFPLNHIPSNACKPHSLCTVNLNLNLNFVISVTDTGARPSCPLQQDTYHFNYNNNSGGICRSPLSYARPCVSLSAVSLHFSRCSDASYTHERSTI